MNLPLNKDRVLSCLDGVLNNNTRLKVVTESISTTTQQRVKESLMLTLL